MNILLVIRRWFDIKLFKAVAILTIFSVATRILGFLFRIYLANILTNEMLGIYTIGVSIFMVFITALSSGLTVTISKLTAEESVFKNNKKANAYTTSGLVLNLVLVVVLLVILVFTRRIFLFFYHDLTIYYLLLSMTPAILFSAIYAPLRGFMWGKEKYFRVSLVELIEQVIRIGSCFILFIWLKNTASLYAAGLSLSLACVLSTALGAVFFKKSGGKLQFEKSSFKPVFKASGTITSLRVLSSVMQPVLALIIPLMLETVGYDKSQALAQLGIASGMTMPLLSIPGTIVGAISVAIIPKISSLVKENKPKQVIGQANTSIILTLSCAFLFLPFFIALGEPLCQWLFNNFTAGTYLQNSAWLAVPMGLATITTSILNSLGLEVKTFKYYIISSVFLLAAIFILPKYVEIYALLYGLGISSIVVSVLNIFKINKTIHNKNYYILPILKLTAITLPSILITKFVYPLLIVALPISLALVVAGIISVVAYCSLLLVTGLVKIDALFSHIKIKKRKRYMLKP